MEQIFLTKEVSDCLIVVPKSPAVTEQTAAEEVQSYLEKALGVKYPIVSESDAVGKCIYVGHTEYAKCANIFGKSMENWIIAMHGGNLILTGGMHKADRGTLYAAYHFLEDMVGVRWWNPYEEDVLSLKILSLDENLYREGTPCFDYRKPYMDSQAGPQVFSYLARTRTNAISPLDDGIPKGVYDETVQKYGGARIAGRPHHVHTMGKYFPADTYFEKHSEWWAWNKVQGKHLKTGSYCLSNEGFSNALLEKLLGTLKEDVELAEKTGVELPSFYSLSIDDVNEMYFCQCDECAGTIKEAGYSGYVIKFVNKVAREVAKQYPFAKIEILAYLNFIEPPKSDILPEKNCIIRLACFSRDILRDIYDSSNAHFLHLLKSWSEICKKAGCQLYIYDYLYNMQVNYPLPLFYGLKKTIEAYREYGVKGLFIEAQKSLEDAFDLNRYLLTHLLEDPDTDEEALINDFLKRYYGNAAKYVKEYLELLRETADRNHIQVWCYREDSRFNYIDSKAAIEGSRILDQAKEAVASQKTFGRRVNWLRKALDSVIAFKFFDLRKMAEANGEQFTFDIKLLKQRVIAALEEYGENTNGTRVTEGVRTEIQYFSDLPEEEEVFDIPEAFKNVDEKDIFQFSLLYMPKYARESIIKYMGYSVAEDKDTVASKVMKLSNDEATGASVLYARNPTSKYAENKNPLTFILQQNGGKVLATKEYYKEDLIQNGYHLYHLGSFAGIAKFHDARVSLVGLTGSINLAGLAVTFPMDACDVYLSMKVTGEVFGGCAGDENAIYFDRMIVVRK